MKTGKNKKKHVFLIFRSSITYPKIEMIGGGHLKYSPCKYIKITRISCRLRVIKPDLNNMMQIVRMEIRALCHLRAASQKAVTCML